MRQGHQHRRSRGRNNNHRKSQNPLSRTYDSNGPDIKIRGTAAHIAEKYLSLARDAASSGDSVMAENYLQHSEHYSRIIMAYREQMAQPGEQPGSAQHGQHRSRFDSDDLDDVGDEMDGALTADPQNQPQPRIEDHAVSEDAGMPRRTESGERERSYHSRDRRDRNRSDRSERRREHSDDRQSGEGQRQERNAAEDGRRSEGGRNEGRSRNRATPVEGESEHPEFLRRPVRRPRKEANGNGADLTAGAAEISETSGHD